MRQPLDRATIKAESEARLRKLGLAVNPALPLLEDDDELTPVTAEQVARRLLVVVQVIGLGFEAPAESLRAYLREHGLWEDLSNRERAMLEAEEPSEQDRIDATWLTEATQVLVWCLGKRELDPFVHFDDDLPDELPADEDVGAFITSASLRDRDEILREADFHYRLHWAARNARSVGNGPRVSESIVRERRRALDWVLGTESDWDEVPLGT